MEAVCSARCLSLSDCGVRRIRWDNLQKENAVDVRGWKRQDHRRERVAADESDNIHKCLSEGTEKFDDGDDDSSDDDGKAGGIFGLFDGARYNPEKRG